MTNNTDPIPGILATAQRAWERGNRSNALAVLRMLDAQHPNDERINALRIRFESLVNSDTALSANTSAPAEPLSPVATSDSRVTAVLPELHSATDGVSTSSSTSSSEAEPIPAAPQSEDVIWPVVSNIHEQQADGAQPIRWPMYAIIAVALIIIGLTALWRLGSTWRSSAQELAGNIQSGQGLTNTLIPTLPVSMEPGSLPAIASPAATLVVPAASSTPEPTPLPTASPIPTHTPSPQPTITPHPVLSQGQIVQSGPWRISLLRPEHAMRLDGAIGNLQPKGRFVLALLSVGYSGDGAARVPATLVLLEDDQGNRYQADANASSSYLDTYGRGQYGDLSLNDELPPDAGNLSIPFIFDVPSSAAQLHLVVSGQDGVWLIPEQ